MNRPMLMCLLSAAWLASAQLSRSAAAELSKACQLKIDSRIPGWRLSPPPDDLAAYAKERKLETNFLQIDLDGDGIRDTAILAVAPSGGDRVQYIAICLQRKSEPELHLIRAPYCGDGITVSPKGQAAHDFQTDKDVTYPTNGVHAYCFEKAGGTYLYKNGRFELLIDSD